MKGKSSITPAERLVRMQAMFDKEYAVLTEDYEFFRQTRCSDKSLDAQKPPSKSVRKSAK
jgi:hypothetical protein